MPQVCQVLRCYHCEIFQVHFIKKSNKWRCKVCNEKQSLKKAFRIGGASECRILVQQLNMPSTFQELNTNAEEWGDTDDTTINKKYPTPDLNEVNEEKEHVDHFIGQSRSADEVWSEDDNSNNRCLPDTVPVYHDEKSASEKNLLTENIKFARTSEYEPEMNNMISTICKNDEQHLQVVEIKDCHGQKKRHFESGNDISSTATAPPFKKNRRFQIIKNAASKLN